MSTEIIIPRKRGQLPTCTCIPRLEKAEKKLQEQDLIIQNLLLQFKDLTEDMKRQENVNKELVLLGLLQDAQPI
jgi:hypothetical protein